MQKNDEKLIKHIYFKEVLEIKELEDSLLKYLLKEVRITIYKYETIFL